MRTKLHAFAAFAATLLPHETAYLLSVQNFRDQERLDILKRMHDNCLHIHQPAAFEETFDKRKYSTLKKWAAGKLQELDADVQFEWMNDMERKIVTDSIHPEEERTLLRALRRAKPTDYFFAKLYDLAQQFRHFLLIRMRLKEHKQADKFLKDHRGDWERSKNTFEKLHEATEDIVGQYTGGARESDQWEKWLSAVFYDDTLDGQNRYFAFVRLIFVQLNYGNLSALLEKFDYQDQVFARGVYYSKRLLLNYYSQRLLLHSKLKDYEKAEYYGNLSIRGRNSDYLFYINNLVAVLLRSKKYKQALELMKSAHHEAKTTRNVYNRIGFVAFYMRCLILNGQFKSAESFGASYLKAYAKEILEYRWHLFFTNYLSALFHLGKNARLLTIARRYDLLHRDHQYKRNKPSSYLPFIPWYCLLAEYIDTGKGLPGLSRDIQAYIAAQKPDNDRLPLVWEFLEEVKSIAPELQSIIINKSANRPPQ